MKRIVYIIIAVDASGSVRVMRKAVYGSVVQSLERIDKADKDSVDFSYRVTLLLFNGTTTVVNNQPLPAGQLLELFDENAYMPEGQTSLANLHKTIDELLSRHSSTGMLGGLQKGDPFPSLLFVTDYLPTDSEKELAYAENLLLSNRFFQRCSRLCIYLGPEQNREAAARMVGGSEHVLTLDGVQIEALLAPVLATTSIIMSDGTHISTGTAQQAAEEARDRAQNGQEGAVAFTEYPPADSQLSDDELARRLEELMGA